MSWDTGNQKPLDREDINKQDFRSRWLPRR